MRAAHSAPRGTSSARPRTRWTTASSSPPGCGGPSNKVYPDYWSFLLGEITLYSFVAQLLSGTYLTFRLRQARASVHGSGRGAKSSSLRASRLSAPRSSSA